MAHVWDDALTDAEREIIRRGGFGQPRPLGRRPAVIIIDAQVNYIGENRPILEQIDRYPSGMGGKAWQALPAIKQLIEVTRAQQVPLIYSMMHQTRVYRPEGAEAIGLYGKLARSPRFMTDDDPGLQVVSRLAPRTDMGDLIVFKDQPSAFFGTPLTSYCMKWRVDSLLLAGGSTSGCVRATAVDAASLNLRVAVVEECVFDRIELSHKASLLDIWMKYGSVIKLHQALDYLRTVEQG